MISGSKGFSGTAPSSTGDLTKPSHALWMVWGLGPQPSGKVLTWGYGKVAAFLAMLRAMLSFL